MARLRTENTYVFVPLFLVLITSPLTSTSHITLTTDGYQNVVVAIDENSGFTSCQQDLENIKVGAIFQVKYQLTTSLYTCCHRNWYGALPSALVKVWNVRLTLVMLPLFCPILGSAIRFVPLWWRRPISHCCLGPGATVRIFDSRRIIRYLVTNLIRSSTEDVKNLACPSTFHRHSFPTSLM